MKQPTGAGRPRTGGSTSEQADTTDILGVLNDDDCRAILDATGEAALTAKELTEACDISQSSVYRKLDELTETNLLEERIRIRESGQHTSEYVRCVDSIDVSVDPEDGIDLTVTRDDESSAPRTGLSTSKTPHAAD